ncbi:hypothetical protein GZA70_004026 [Salmonella enterica]|nr:hypothetical protein [Salmonella enterica]EDB9445788.1 hypothetical protein [Salmonella enterica subsp. enterica serovar Enteritidis]EBN2823973.1 hypothetical protein [Salmonella enterica]ECU1627757.1 hypothetical protein [Salmonella enterica]EDB9460248.1 hypothetical protein [Salmonella enterica subsp. enterica serovar Enteritidis]
MAVSAIASTPQYEQLISRDMADLKKENLGYYIQILDFEIDKIISEVFSDDVFFMKVTVCDSVNISVQCLRKENYHH